MVRPLARREISRPDFPSVKNDVKDFNPRQAVRGLLQSIAPARPLFLPIVFSLGARIENISLRNFLTNPTKISNALRQIRTHLRSDGITCYFDPYLEAEALGGVLDWESDARRPSLRWPQPSHDGELPEGLCAPDETAKRGRVPIAIEVIRRLKPLVRDDFLLVAGVTGPLTLAAQLAQYRTQRIRPQTIAAGFGAKPRRRSHSSRSTCPRRSRRKCNPNPRRTSPIVSRRSSRLVLAPRLDNQYRPLLRSSSSFAPEPGATRSKRNRKHPPRALGRRRFRASRVRRRLRHGTPRSRIRNLAASISIRARSIQHRATHNRSLRKIIPEFHPALVTTTSDLPSTADLKISKCHRRGSELLSARNSPPPAPQSARSA